MVATFKEVRSDVFRLGGGEEARDNGSTVFDGYEFDVTQTLAGEPLSRLNLRVPARLVDGEGRDISLLEPAPLAGRQAMEASVIGRSWQGHRLGDPYGSNPAYLAGAAGRDL